jgi:hypothetical protein
VTEPTTNGDIDIGRQIGRLEGRVESVANEISGVKSDLHDMQIRSTAEHAEVRQSIRDGVNEIESKLTGRLNKHADELDDLQESRAKGRGIILLLLTVSTIAGATAAVLNAAGVL